MKKLLILALVAIVAGAAFAETDPVFSGSFSILWGYSFANVASNESNDLSTKLDLGATIDEFNTVSVTVGLADAMFWDDTFDNDEINDWRQYEGAPNVGELGNRGNYLRMDGFTLNTDVTGALGVNAPVAVSTKLGEFGFGTVNVANVAPKSVDMVGGTGADGGVGLGMEVTIMDMVTLGSVLYPVNAFQDKKGETGITLKATGILDMIDVAAFFIASEHDLSVDPNKIENYTQQTDGAIKATNELAVLVGMITEPGANATPEEVNTYNQEVAAVTTKYRDDNDFDGDFAKDLDGDMKLENYEFNLAKELKDKEGMNAGMSFAIDPPFLEGFKFGFGFAYDMVNKNGEDKVGIFSSQLDLAFDMVDNLVVGLSYGTEDLTKFVDTSASALSITYDAMDNLSLFGATKYDFTIKDEAGRDWDVAKDFHYDVGMIYSLKALAIQVGASDNYDFKAPADDYNDVVYVKFSTSF